MGRENSEGGILLAGGTVVTLDADHRVIENGAVRVQNDRIVAVGKRGDMEKSFKGTVLEASGCIIMPGLVNAHTHLPMSLFRGLADDLPLMEWLTGHMFPAEAAHIRPETVYTATLLSCAEMLLSGTTFCCDGYFHEDSTARAVAESGMRAILAQGVIDYPAPGVPDPSKNVEAALMFVRSAKGRFPAIEPSIFCHSPYTCSAETLIRAKTAAREENVLLQIHVAETDGERDQCFAQNGVSPVGYLDRLGVLDERTLLVHAVAVDDADLSMIKKSGAAVVHVPESNMKLGSGVAPVPDMLAHGIPVALGTDGCASNNDLDMFGEAATTALLHKAFRKDPTVMNAETALRMATEKGAEALGSGSVTGSLEPGKKADIIVVDTRRPHLVPMYSPLSHLVYSARGSDVRDVMVDGRLVVRQRKLLTLDLERIMERMERLGSVVKGKA